MTDIHDPASPCPVCKAVPAVEGGPCETCGMAIMRENQAIERASAVGGHSALVWVGGDDQVVLSIVGSQFSADEFHDAVQWPDGPGLWLWSGAAKWSDGGDEYPHERDLILFGEWTRPPTKHVTAEQLETVRHDLHGAFGALVSWTELLAEGITSERVDGSSSSASLVRKRLAELDGLCRQQRSAEATP